jgi:hypothetical protein
MQVVMQRAGFLVLLTVALGMALPSFAQAPGTTPSDSEHPGSVIVFPKFMKGTVAVDGVTRAQTEIEVRVGCPTGAACPEHEPVKIRFHWICPGDDFDAKQICRGASFEIVLPVDGKAVFNPEDPALTGNNFPSVAPCPMGYLIGWVITPTINRPIKYDGLTGNAVLRDGSGATQSYDAIAIPAEPNLATRAEIATDVDSRTGAPALVFDGGAGHYQPVARGIQPNLKNDRLTGPLSSAASFLILLTLDVRVNRPNYPTFIDLNYRSDQGIDASTGRNFTCWTEIKDPNLDEYFTLAGARTRNAVVLAGQAVKVPFGGASDIPGPVTLLGLVPTDPEQGRSMDPAYIVQGVDNTVKLRRGGRRSKDPADIVTGRDSGKPTTVFVPFD